MEDPGHKDQETPVTSTDLQLYCTPCKAEGNQEIAEGYCEVCHEYLCSACVSCHRKFRMTKSHRILQGDDIPSRTTCDQQVDISCTEACEVHPGKFIEYFCEDHDVAGCGPCTLINHRTCKLNFIPDVAGGYRDSNEYKALESTIKEIETTLIQLEGWMNKETKETEEIYSTAINDIRRVRAEVNRYLDENEEKLQEKVNQFKLKNEKVLQDVQTRHKQLQKQFDEIKDQIRNSANEITKLFLVAKRVTKIIVKLSVDCSLALTKSNIIQYYMKASQKLKDVLSVENALGEIVERKAICNFRRGLTLTHKVKITHSDYGTVKYGPYISGLCLLSPDTLLTADTNNKILKLVDISSQRITSTLGLTSGPWDVTCLPEDQAAATVLEEKEIQIVSTRERLSRVREIKTSGKCYGICYSDGKLLVTYCRPGKLEVIGLGGIVYKSVTTDNKGYNVFSKPEYITLLNTDTGKYIYVSDNTTETVTKLSMEGKIVSQFQDQRLSRPRGLAAIGDNHIAMCSYKGNTIIVIRDENGKMEIVKEWDCVTLPLTIECSLKDSTLYVSSGRIDENKHVLGYKLAR